MRFRLEHRQGEVDSDRSQPQTLACCMKTATVLDFPSRSALQWKGERRHWTADVECDQPGKARWYSVFHNVPCCEFHPDQSRFFQVGLVETELFRSDGEISDSAPIATELGSADTFDQAQAIAEDHWRRRAP